MFGTLLKQRLVVLFNPSQCTIEPRLVTAEGALLNGRLHRTYSVWLYTPRGVKA